MPRGGSGSGLGSSSNTEEPTLCKDRAVAQKPAQDRKNIRQQAASRLERNLRRQQQRAAATRAVTSVQGTICDRSKEGGGGNGNGPNGDEKGAMERLRESLQNLGFVTLKEIVKEKGYPFPKFANKENLIQCIVHKGQRVRRVNPDLKSPPSWRLRPLLEKPCKDLSRIDWSQVCGCHRSETGHGGVFFVKLKNDGVVVLKSCADIAQQVLASTLISWLGLRAARCRIMQTHSPEFQLLLSKLRALNCKLAAYKLSRRSYALVFEFIPGTALKHLSPPDLERMRLTPHPASNVTLMEQCCRTMGQISAMDALLYYDGDRIPIVCQTRGNGGNIIVGPGNYKVCAIDNGANFINSSSEIGRERAYKYFSETKAALDTIISKPKEVACQMLMVRKMMDRYIGWEAPDEFLLNIQAGFIDGARRILEEFPDTKRMKTFTQMMEKVDPPIPGIKDIDLQFIEDMLKVFSSTLRPTDTTKGDSHNEVESSGDTNNEVESKSSNDPEKNKLFAINQVALQRVGI